MSPGRNNYDPSFDGVSAWTPPHVGVRTATPDDLQRARILAAETGLRLVEGDDHECDLLLVAAADGIMLVETGPGAAGGINADFGETCDAVRRLGSASRGQPLARAVGIKKHTPMIVDATAGLGRDAAFLVGLGCTVIAVERSEVLGAMLSDALERARAALTEITEPAERNETYETCPETETSAADAFGLSRLTLVVGDAVAVLSRMTDRAAPDVVYLDPMYPSSGKSALPKKEMRILRRMVGDDPDARVLLEAARRAARDRVVVKRPPRAAPLAPDPSMSYESKLTRYDVYLTQR